jgi:signal peptidase I
MNDLSPSLRLLILSSLFVLALSHSLFGVYRINGSSMEPLLGEGKNVIVVKLLPFSSIHRGDIIVYKSPIDGRPVIKRCIALPGESFQREGSQFPVPPGMLATAGDNGSHSIDSRHYGAVDKHLLIGKVIFPLLGGGLEE